MVRTILTTCGLFVLVLWVAPGASRAQDDSDTLPNGLFKPDFIMRHQTGIQLTDAQRESIMEEVAGLQARVFQLPDGPEKTQKILGAVSRINDVLTLQQKEKLRALHNAGGSPSGGAQALFTGPRRVEIRGYHDLAAKEPFISRDGKFLFFNNTNDKPGTDTHVYYARRIDDAAFQLVGPVKGLDASVKVPDVNSAVPSLDTGGNFYFTTSRSYASDFNIIYHGLFKDGAVADVKPVVGISRHKPTWFTMDGEIAQDGGTLYYSDNHEHTSIIRAAARNADGSFTPLADSDELLKTVNNGEFNYAPSSSSDGLELFFTRGMAAAIYVVKRASTSEPFGPAQLAVAATDGNVEAPSISGDGRHLYFAKKEGGDPYLWNIYVATREK